MTLVDATATVIDHCKSTMHDHDRVLAKAIKRLEQRLRLLQLRRAKTVRRNRREAWWLCRMLLLRPPGGIGPSAPGASISDFTCCLKCRFKIDFGVFIKSAIISGRGQIKTFFCPNCSILLIGIPPADEI